MKRKSEVNGSYILYPEQDGEGNFIRDSFNETIEIYELLFRLETSDESGVAFIRSPGKRLARLLLMQGRNGSVFFGSEGNSAGPAWIKIISAEACFTGVVASACSLVEEKGGAECCGNFPDYKKMFRASLAAGNSLKENLPDDIDSFNEAPFAATYCYWAFAALFRLTGCMEWLTLCSRFEEKVVELKNLQAPDSTEKTGIISRPPCPADMSAAAVWALYRSGGAGYYKNQLELLYGADNEIRIF